MPTLPVKFCHQVRYIWEEAIGKYRRPGRLGMVSRARWEAGDQPVSNIAWQEMYHALQKEHGLPPLQDRNTDRLELFANYIMSADIKDALFAIEIVFRQIAMLSNPEALGNPSFDALRRRMRTTPEPAIEELNQRFKDNQLPYEFRDKSISSLP